MFPRNLPRKSVHSLGNLARSLKCIQEFPKNFSRNWTDFLRNLLGNIPGEILLRAFIRMLIPHNYRSFPALVFSKTDRIWCMHLHDSLFVFNVPFSSAPPHHLGFLLGLRVKDLEQGFVLLSVMLRLKKNYNDRFCMLQSDVFIVYGVIHYSLARSVVEIFC